MQAKPRKRFSAALSGRQLHVFFVAAPRIRTAKTTQPFRPASVLQEYRGALGRARGLLMPHNKAGGHTVIGLIMVAVAIFATGSLAFLALVAGR